MKTLFLIILLAPLFSLASNNILLTLGESHKIRLRGSPTIWIQDRKVVKAEAVGSFLVLKSLNEGQTLLRVDSQTYKIQVLHPLSMDATTELKIFLRSVVGLKAETRFGQLQVTGNLYRLQDWIKLSDFAKSKDLKYRMKVELPDSLQQEAQAYFATEFTKAKLPPQTMIFSPTPEIRLKASALLIEKYERLLAAYGVDLTKDPESLEIAPTVKVEVTIAEVSRDLERTWGVQWPAAYAASILPDGSWNRGSIDLELKAFEKTGQARILASPNLICRSGEEAEFTAGGEFPIPVIGYRSKSITWRKYGISVKIKPKADASGRIRLTLETEVTTMDRETGTDGVPGLKTHKVSSHFDVTKPQTIALSGLIKNQGGQISEGLPGISQIPILGSLFSSKNFLENKSELIIFVRPSLLTESSERASLPTHLQEGQNAFRN